jgi:hypothetical protein
MDRVNLPLDDLKQRFLQRAAAEGIVLSDKIKRGTDSSLERIFRFIPPFTWTWKAQLAAACTLLIIGLLTLVMGYRIRNLREENSIAHEEISKLKRAMAGAEQQPPNILPQSSDTTRFSGLSEQKVEPQSKSQTEWEISELRRELRKSKAEHESLLSKSRTLEEQLQHASNEVTALRSQILSLKDQATDGQRLKETEIALRQVSLELEKLQR